MLWLKTCPRCHGDLAEGHDRHGRYITCIQCGNYITDRQELTLRQTGALLPLGASRAA